MAWAFFKTIRPFTFMGNSVSRRSPTAFLTAVLSVNTAMRFFSPFGPRTMSFVGLSLSMLSHVHLRPGEILEPFTEDVFMSRVDLANAVGERFAFPPFCRAAAAACALPVVRRKFLSMMKMTI